MAIFTGFGGHISKGAVGGGSEAAIAAVRKWSVNPSADLTAIIDSSTANAEVAVPGNQDWSGNFDAIGHTPVVMPGDYFEFEGAATGAAATAKGVKGPVKCEGVTIDIDVEGGGPITHNVKFGSMGAYTVGTITCPADDSIPDPIPATGLLCEVATDPFTSFSSLGGIRRMTIDLSRKMQSPVVAGWKTRATGALTGSLKIETYADDATPWTVLPAPNTVLAVRVYVTATLFWLFKWMMVKSPGPFDVDIQGQSIVGGGLDLQLCTATQVSTVATRGTIIKPDLSVYFP